MRNIRLSTRLLPALLALSLASAACKDEKPVAEQAPSAPASAVASAAKPESPATRKALADVTMPDEVVAVAAADAPLDALDALTKAMATVQPGGDSLSKSAADALAERYGLSPEVVDLSKPVALAVFDPKKHAIDPLVVVLRVGSKDKLLAAAKGDKNPDAGGGLVSWGRSFARVDGDLAIVTQETELLAKNEPFLRELAAATAGAGVTVVVPMQHIGALYGKDIEALSQQAAAFGPAEQAKTTQQMFSFVSSALAELDQVSIALKPTSDGVALDVGAKPKALSSWRAAFEVLKSKEMPKIAAKLPKDSVAFATVTFPAEARPLVRKYFEWAASLPGAGSVNGVMGIWEQSWDAMTGEVAFCVFQLDDKPVAFAVSGVTDSAKVRDLQRAAAEKTTTGQQAEDMRKLCIDISFKKAAYKIGDVEVDVMKTKLAAAPPGADLFLSWLGETHSAVSASEAVVAYGPSGKAVLEAYLSGKLAGGFDGSPAMARAKTASVKDAIAVSTISPNDLAVMAGLPVPKSALPPVTISAGTSDGALHFGIDLPAAQLTAIAVGFGAIQSAAMGGGAGAPGPGAGAPGPGKKAK